MATFNNVNQTLGHSLIVDVSTGKIRANWYLLMSLVKTEDAQRRGIVLVAYCHKVLFGRILDRDWVQGIPWKVSSIHMCLIDGGVIPTNLIKLLLFKMADSSRVRTRIHTGTQSNGSNYEIVGCRLEELQHQTHSMHESLITLQAPISNANMHCCRLEYRGLQYP